MPNSSASGAIVARRYRLVHLLGEGGMGRVWRANDELTGESVALKILKDQPSQSQHLKRLLREAKAVMALDHPNVVKVFDALETEDGAPMLVMELLVGESLGARLKRDRELSVAHTVEIMMPVVSAVGTAHARGVIHRDLKPENIFLVATEGDAPHVKVLDFGIAKVLGPEHEATLSTLTVSGHVMGTPRYMAPEQAFGDDVVDHRADIWALGLILYQCLTGILPTDAKNVGQIFKILLTRRIWPLRDLNPTVPADLASMVDRMLAREVKKRPVDLCEVLAVLKTHSRTITPNFGSVATDNKSNGVSGEWNNVDVSASIESVAPRPSRRSRIPLAHAVVGFGFAGGALATVLAASIGLLHSTPAPAPELASVRVTPEEHRTAPPVETPSEVAARIVGEPAPASAALVVPNEERPLPQKHSGGRRRADRTSRSASAPTETAPPPGASTPDRARTPQGPGLAIELDNPYEHK